MMIDISGHYIAARRERQSDPRGQLAAGTLFPKKNVRVSQPSFSPFIAASSKLITKGVKNLSYHSAIEARGASLRRRTVYLLAASLSFVLAAQTASAQGAADGSITGQVISSRNHKPVAGVLVRLRDTDRSTTTGADGRYSFEHVNGGNRAVVVSKPSGAEIVSRVDVRPGAAAVANVEGDFTATAAEEILVTAQRTPIALARRVQQQAPNLVNVQTYTEIRKLPDITTAEAVRRVPGISLETDEGEGRYVNIRGLDADLNSTTFGGLRLPPTNNASPFGGYRAVTLDSIPIGLVGAITVTKTNTPSMDAESLGGTIEITPRTAPRGEGAFLQGNIGTGYEPLRKTGIIDLAATAGGHFGGPGGLLSAGPFSIVLSGTYYDDRRGIDDAEPAYFNDSAHPFSAINNFDQRDYELHRTRHAFGLTLGYDPDPNNSWYLRAFDAGYTERYIRPHLSLTPDGNTIVLPNGQLQDTLAANGAITEQLRDEKESSRDRVVMFGGRNIFGSDGENVVDYRFGFTQGDFKKPYDFNSTFSLNPAFTAGSTITYSPTGPGRLPLYSIAGAPYTDPAHYALTSFRNSTAYNYDYEFSMAGNYERRVNLFGSQNGKLKLGGSARLRKKVTSAQPYSYPTLPALNLTDFASSGNETYYGGLYQNGVDIRPGALQAQLGAGTITPTDAIGAQQQFLSAHEDVIAGYLQYQADYGRLHVLAGVRVENTKDRSSAFGTLVDAFGNSTITPVSARSSYTNAFPSAQLKYDAGDGLVLRLAYSTSLARPGFNQSIPAIAVDLGSNTITQGNPSLKPATASSFDLSIEKYLPGAGIISLGLFQKNFSNYIVPRTVPASSLPPVAGFNYNGGTLQSVTFVNVPTAYARGIELNFEHRFRELPGLLGGFGLSGNFTYVDSRFEIRPGEISPLPSTSQFTYNAAISYEMGPLNLRLAAYSTSADLFAIGNDATGDIYNATRTSMDFGGSYKLNRHFSVYFAAKNLLNTPHAFYQGTPNRPIQREFYKQTYQGGIRFEF